MCLKTSSWSSKISGELVTDHSAPSGNDLRQPYSFLGLCCKGNPGSGAQRRRTGRVPCCKGLKKTRGESMLEEEAPCDRLRKLMVNILMNLLYPALKRLPFRVSKLTHCRPKEAVQSGLRLKPCKRQTASAARHGWQLP